MSIRLSCPQKYYPPSVAIKSFLWRIKIPSCVLLRALLSREPIPQILEPIPGKVCILPVLPSYMLHCVEPMDPTAWVKRHNRPVDGPPFEPTPTGRRPCRSLHKFVRVHIEIRDGGLGRGDGLDVLGLELFEHVDYVFRGVLDDGEHGTVANWRVWTQEH